MHKLANKIFETKAPAKINLCLKVTGRRSNAYHNLDMINATVTLHDKLKLSFARNPTISVKASFEINDPKLISELNSYESNLAAKAATSFCNYYKFDFFPSIEIEKNIPLGAGLAGGSTDAAALLKLLAKISLEFELLGISQKADLDKVLLDLATSLGADVPFFLGPPISRVRGIGENIDHLPDLEKLLTNYPCCLIYPNQAINTGLVFKTYKENQQSFSNELNLPKFEKLTQLFDLISNDLYTISSSLCPKMAQVFQKLTQDDGFLSENFIVCMSGSGSSLFVLPKELSFYDQGLKRIKDLVTDCMLFDERLIFT